MREFFQRQPLLIVTLSLGLSVIASYIAYKNFMPVGTVTVAPVTEIPAVKQAEINKPLATLFVAAQQQTQPRQSAKPLNVTVAGIAWSDNPWQSVVILQQAGKQLARRQGETLPGFPDARITAVGKESVEIIYGGEITQLALAQKRITNREQHVPADRRRAPVTAELLNNFLALLPEYNKKNITAWHFLPRNFYTAEKKWGIQASDVVLQINGLNMLKPEEAARAETLWKTVRVADVRLLRNGKIVSLQLNIAG